MNGRVITLEYSIVTLAIIPLFPKNKLTFVVAPNAMPFVLEEKNFPHEKKLLSLPFRSSSFYYFWLQ
jgi:hypothetical protein